MTNIVDFCISVGYFILGASSLRDNIYCTFFFFFFFFFNMFIHSFVMSDDFFINIRWVYQENKSEKWNLHSPYFSWQIIFAIINFSCEIRDSPPPPNIPNIFLNFFSFLLNFNSFFVFIFRNNYFLLFLIIIFQISYITLKIKFVIFIFKLFWIYLISLARIHKNQWK